MHSALEVPRGVDAKPIQLKKVVVKLRRGEEVGKNYIGFACVPSGTVEWRGGRINITDDELTETFREELQKYNYPVVGDPNALFDDPSTWKAELLVAGQVNKLELSACYPLAGFGNYRDSKGGAYVQVAWQVYGQLERKVVYEVTTEGSYQSDSSAPMGIEKNLANAFGLSVQNLLADRKFNDLVTRRELGGKSVATGGINSIAEDSVTLNLKSASPLGVSLEAARNATLTVYAGSGHGSGFIISPEGYAITNEHVVREARFVTVRLANGRKIVADVVRADSARDVALLKLREENLPAATLARSTQPAVGTDVFAIGTPLRDELDITVTRGIVSAYRDDRGQKFLQSDAQVHPGNSGGPLVAADGRVVGIAVQGYMIGRASQNLNFFVPIDDAVAALRITFR
ncbi:S1C family serine protease [Chitinimonas arctica]|uniref:S1C family serine protease n=1 Tax=Chitinimonas arctica TaxID=2594795 RepID=UPI0015D2C256|nr:S1C family serine protease [Chitinimonas arctica]